jgi:hypothetical protein
VALAVTAVAAPSALPVALDVDWDDRACSGFGGGGGGLATVNRGSGFGGGGGGLATVNRGSGFGGGGGLSTVYFGGPCWAGIDGGGGGESCIFASTFAAAC